MAAPTMTVSRLGQSNLGGDVQALFLTQYAGGVLTTFANATKFLDKQIVRSIQSGDSAQFPVMGLGTSEYHTPGTMITGSAIAHAEKLINIDGLLIAPRFLARIDEAMNHYDVRSLYTKEAGSALGRQFDSNVAQVIALAARASATITSGPTGGAINNVDVTEDDSTDANSLYQAAFAAQTAMDADNIPEEDRYLGVKPAAYNTLVKGLTAVSDVYSDGNGSIAKGKVYELAGFTLVKSNQVPSTNVVTGPTAYQGDFSHTVGLAWHPSAIGTVKLLDLATEMEYSTFHQGWLVVAKYAYGHGILRPEAAIELLDN